MSLFPGRIFTAFFTSLFFSSPAQAVSLTSIEQVDLVVEWFTGSFNNQQQVTQNPDVPFLTMTNCLASPVGNTPDTDSLYVHLEQYFGGTNLLRSSAYQFSPLNSGVNLQVYSYLERNDALGTCLDSNPRLNLTNLVSPSCDLTLTYEPELFFGTNSPLGCPSGFPVAGSRVVSTVTITANQVLALDIFEPPDSPSFGTQIQFEQLATTPEPLGALPLISLGLIGFVTIRQR